MKVLLLYPVFLFVGLGSAKVVTVTAPASIPSNEPQYKEEKSFTSAILNSTNFYRAEHNASDVSWNKTLEDFASDYLDSNGCEFEHSGGPYGENLARGYPNVTASVEGWGNERKDYNFKKGKFDHDTGHFTQLVWKNTTDVGCGRLLCGDKGWYLVCEYWPRGNVVGAFKEMVEPEEALGAVVRPRVGLAFALFLVYALVWL